mgnify:CR=1 FL=1
MSTHIKEAIKNGEYHGRDHSKAPELYDQHCESKKARKYLVDPTLSPKLFLSKIAYEAGTIMHPPGGPFIIDDDNRQVVEQLFHYVAGHKDFKGDLEKGLLLIGPYGSGKSLLAMLLMKSLAEFWYYEISTLHPDNRKSPKTIFLPARDILAEEEYYSPAGDGSKTEAYKTRGILCVDDLGKEPTVVNDFGTKTKPWEDVAAFRYDTDLLTFATSNLKISDMSYSGHCKSRMHAMMNTIILKGENRRK